MVRPYSNDFTTCVAGAGSRWLSRSMTASLLNSDLPELYTNSRIFSGNFAAFVCTKYGGFFVVSFHIYLYFSCGSAPSYAVNVVPTSTSNALAATQRCPGKYWVWLYAVNVVPITVLVLLYAWLSAVPESTDFDSTLSTWFL